MTHYSILTRKVKYRQYDEMVERFMFKKKKITKGSQIFLGSISATLLVLSEKGLFGGGV